jgi:hypothetical protein
MKRPSDQKVFVPHCVPQQSRYLRSITMNMSSRSLYGLIVAVFSVAYYALYLNSGFNFSDAGHYAQVCYEMLLGRDPSEFVIGYGILWFKIGENLFRLFGVDYTLVKLLFYACIVLTNVLVFYTVNLATNNRFLALVAALASALVPAFPATSFYALCIVSNVAVQMRLVQGSRQPLDFALAGAVVSIAFQIRSDFGYVFAALLFVVIALIVIETRGPQDRRHRYWRTQGGAALLGFLGALALGFFAAVVGGYGGIFLQQFSAYPALAAQYFVDGLQALFLSQVSTGTLASGLIQRPLVEDIFSGEWRGAHLALLVYLPVLVMAAFALLSAVQFFRSERSQRMSDLARAIITLSAAAAAFPHYFFYRPDISHIANFMPGYLVLIAIFSGQIYQHLKRGMPVWGRYAAGFVVLTLTINLGIYLWAGLHTPGTGSIAGAAGRTESFFAGNGVTVRVTPEEKSELEFLRDTILQNSKRDDFVVCVPYCPGVAFMTERKMLLPNFYVDDTLLLLQPSWASDAIALTRNAKPAVVIVIDWAINGTEQSRFANWAASYVAAVEELSRDKVVNGNITAYIL